MQSTTTCTPTQTRYEMPMGYEMGKYSTMLNRDLLCGPCGPQMYGGQQWMNQQMCPPWMQPYQQQQMMQQQQQQQPWWCWPEQQQYCNNQMLCNMPGRPCCPMEMYCLTNPIRMLNREGDRCLSLCFDMRCYKPEEINVTCNRTERCLTIECNHEQKEGKEHHIQRKYFRKYCFPECLGKCDLSKCEPRCWMTQDGYLNIECQLPRMTVEEMNRVPMSCYPGQYGCYTPVNCKIN